MAKWQEQEGKLFIENKPKALGCVYVFVGLIGLATIVVVILFLLGSWKSLNLQTMSIAGIIFLFGFIFFYTGFSNKKMNYRYTLIFDRKKEEVVFYKDIERPFTFGMAQIVYARMVKVRKSSGSGRSRHSYDTYQLFLVLKDGAHFWIDTFLKTNEAEEKVRILIDYAGFKVVDKSGLGLNRDASSHYTNDSMYQPPEQPSTIIRIQDTIEEKRISIKEKNTIGLIFVKLAAFLIFYSMPLFIFFSNGKNTPLVFFIFGIVFSVIWYSILLVITFVSLKKVQIVLRYDDLALELKFLLPPLNSLLGSSISIPRHHIRYVRLHRLDEGNYWLAVSVVKDSSVPNPGFLFNAGFFHKDAVEDIFPGEKVFGLWEAAGYMKSGHAADYDDLLFLEKLIEKQYRLQEEAIASN